MLREINQGLFDTLDKIKITKEINLEGDIQIVTQFGQRELRRVNVSKIYEIFDFGPFATNATNKLVKDFNITKYDLRIVGGKQELTLEGDTIEISGKQFTKRFYILSSSDKSRRLQLNFGLYSTEDYYTLISSQGRVSRKHITGLNNVVDDMLYFDNDVFNDQIELLEKIIGDTIRYSQVRKTILEMGDGVEFADVKKGNLLKLKAFNNMLKFGIYRGIFSQPILNRIPKYVESVTAEQDFEIDSYDVFKTYLRLFRNKDSYEMKKETEKISKITKRGFREGRLARLLG
jgi:hypothetical protein